MLVTITNASASVKMNYLDTFTSGPSGATFSIVATGGNTLNALPMFMSRNGEVAASGALQLPIAPADWRNKPVAGLGFDSRDQLNWLVQAGKCTVTIASQTGRRDVEELYVTAV